MNGNSEGVDVEDLYMTSAIGLAHHNDAGYGRLYLRSFTFHDAYTVQMWSY